MRRLLIHMGTPKTGSTAVQRYARARHKYLKSKGIDFLPRGRRASYNDLGIALRGRLVEDANEICANISEMIAQSDAHTVVITSEMFTGGDPNILRDGLSLQEPFEVRIIGYFRRQDRYLESLYKQKMKTGKVAPGFQNYIDKYGTAAGEYLRIVDTWQDAWPEAEFVFRRFESKRFTKGDVVFDFMEMLGLDIEADDKLPAPETANPTPSIDLLDLMQIVSKLPGFDARRVFRTMPVADLPRFKGRAMNNAAARNLLDAYSADNEALRARFFPSESALFAVDDLDGPEPEIATPSFSDDQKVMIRALMDALIKNARTPQQTLGE